MMGRCLKDAVPVCQKEAFVTSELFGLVFKRMA